MPLENANNLMELNPLWPVGATDNVDEGDDHIRQMKNVLQLIFPVGAIYTTKLQSVDPNVFIGGTWTLLPEERFLRQANSGQSGGETGGGDTLLTSSNLPSHAHDSGSLWTLANGNHDHPIQGQLFAGSGTDTGTNFTAQAGPGNTTNNRTGLNGSHQHTIDGNTGFAGGNAPFEAVPRYVAVYHWERTA